MNILLEKQIREYFDKNALDIPQNIAGLLNIIAECYNGFEHSIETCEQENTALKTNILHQQKAIDGITAEKEAAEAAAKNELTNRIFFEQDLAGVYRTTTGGKIISCNQAFATMLGYASPQELLHINSVELYFAKEDRDKFISDLKDHKKLQGYNFMLKRKDGSPLYVMENSVVFNDKATGEEYCDGILIDITALIKAEAELLASEKRYRQIVETAQEGIWTLDEDDKTNFVNRRMAEMLGYTQEEMIGKRVHEFMREEWKAAAESRIERRRMGITENTDVQYLTKSGREVWASLSANPVLDDNGNYKGALGMVTDITERKHQEELLQKSEANLRTIFDNADSFYVLFNAGLNIVSFNKVAERILHELGMPQLEEGRNAMDYFSKERLAYVKDFASRALKGETISYEIVYTKPDGTDKWYDIKWMGVKTNEDESKWGVILSSTDITEKKLAALEREKITADLVQRNNDLQQFNYIVSHNLRAPVANIMGLAALLAGEEPGEPVNRDLLKGLQTSIGNLDEIIKDLNYILQLKAGGAHEKREPIYLQQLVDAIKMSIGNIIETEKAQINCHFEGVESVVAIRSYLYSIFYNLILNSIKYKQQGLPPVINITSIKHKGETELLFADNGKGIDLGRYGKDIFGLYKRFDTKVEGKGMGLFMVKTQVEHLGGKITVQSKVNRGTTFKLELPV